MSKFALSSKYFTNILLIADNISIYRDQRFSIIINESIEIDLPLVVAASLSKTVTHMLETDQTATELHININTNRNIKSSLDKIRRCISAQECVNIDEDDTVIFAEFGNCIGNDDFSIPIKERLDKESSSLNEEDVINVLNMKQKFSIVDRSKEVSFIASNFESMRAKSDFIDYSSNYNNIEIIEEVLSSSKLSILSEDSLVTFLITICCNNKGNESFLRLFDKVLFEYCSSQCCEEYLHFINDISDSPVVKLLISCMGRRFIQSKIPLDPPFIEGRHLVQINEEPHTEITNEESLNGIFRREYKKDNVLLEPSSTNSYNNVYNMVRDNEQSFQSHDIQNSFFQASLKNGKTFVIKKYAVSGYRGGYDVQHWRLEGQRASDGVWILIDRQQNHPLTGNNIHTFNISCEEKLKAVKFTQEGATTRNNYYVTISGFDIFGSLYDQ